MIVDLHRTAAAICPACSNTVMGRLSVFNFSGERSLQILCPTRGCAHSCALITPKRKKFKIDVHCPFCGGVHTHTIDSDKFWKRDLITFPCPEVGVSSFFLGAQGKVEQALGNSIERFAKIYDEAIEELEDLDDFDEDSNDILYDMLDTIHDLRDSGLLTCVCGSESVSVNAIGKNVLLSCPRCRRSKLIKADEKNLAMILNATAIVLGR